MITNYIPSTDSEYADWLGNFSTQITATPNVYGLVAGDAVVIAAQNTAFQAAYAVSITPATRTSVTVAAKDIAKTNSLAIVRPYAIRISLNAAVLVSNKVSVGVNPRTSIPTPIPAPTSVPVLSLTSSTFLQSVLRYRDDAAPATSRAKPFGATAIQIFGVTSAAVVSNPDTLPLISMHTKVPVRLQWDSSDRGKTAYIAARWITRTGEVGPWSDILNVVVA